MNLETVFPLLDYRYISHTEKQNDFISRSHRFVSEQIDATRL